MASNVVNFVDDLPYDILVEILSFAGATSSQDVFEAKMACKRLLNASDDNLIYKRMSLDRFPIIQWFPNPKMIALLKRCLEVGNPNAIYRLGLWEYFSHANSNKGLLILKDAANNGQLEAVYVYGLVLLASGDEYSKSIGLDLLIHTFSSKLSIVSDIRDKVLALLRTMWIKNPMPSQEVATVCEDDGHLGYSVSPFDSEMIKLECMKCFWCSELGILSRYIGGRMM